MNYQEYSPQSGLDAFVKCYWTLEVSAEAETQKQRIVPDGCVEMVFLLGDDIKRYTAGDSFIVQPRAFILGQITKPFFVEPMGYVHSFGVRFYPYGLIGLIPVAIKDLADTETPLAVLLGAESANVLSQEIIDAPDTEERVSVIERFLVEKLNNTAFIQGIVQETVDTMLATNGAVPIGTVLKKDASKRRQLERKFIKQIGLSPKQLSKVVRLQVALKMMLESERDDLSKIAYKSDYYDQAHFIKDFKEFTGLTPKEFFESKEMKLSSLFYK